MPEMRFDTEKMVERLEDAGVPSAQARAHVSLLVNSINTTEESVIERCASKQELADNTSLIKAEFEKQRSHFDNEFQKLRLHVDTEIEKLRFDFDARLSKMKTDLVLLAVTVSFLQIGLIAALVLKLVP